MLTCKKCCWRDNGNLHARHRRNKGRAHGDLGFSKSNIATDQAIHRLTGRQIPHNITDRAQLVICFLIWETGAEFFPGMVLGLENWCRAQSAFGRDPDKPVGHLADAFLELGFLGLPCAPAKFVQKPLVVTIFRKQLDVFDWQVKPRVFSIFKADTFVSGPCCGNHLKPVIPPDAVIDVHHQITR